MRPFATLRTTESRPPHLRRQRHQDRLDVAAGHQPELGAAVVQQVELDIAAAAHELFVALGLGPWLFESAGVPDTVAEICDLRLRIPMRSGLRSINVALAGSMVLGEALRQTQHFTELA